MAMILAGAALLRHLDSHVSDQAARAIYECTLEAVYDGVRTPDLGGHTHTTEFTDAVIERVKKRSEIWSSMGRGCGGGRKPVWLSCPRH